jgi:hypothetical protein
MIAPAAPSPSRPEQLASPDIRLTCCTTTPTSPPPPLPTRSRGAWRRPRHCSPNSPRGRRAHLRRHLAPARRCASARPGWPTAGARSWRASTPTRGARRRPGRRGADHQVAGRLPFRRDAGEAVRAFAETDAAAALDRRGRRLLAHWLRDFRRAGHELPDEQRPSWSGCGAARRAGGRSSSATSTSSRRDRGDPRASSSRPGRRLHRPPAARVREGTFRVSSTTRSSTRSSTRPRPRPAPQSCSRHWNRAAEQNRPLLIEALDLRRRIASTAR